LPCEGASVKEAGKIEQGVAKQYSKIGREILRLSRNQLLVNLRFLDVPLSRLTWFEEPIIPLATDGRFLYYDSRHIINRYKSERNATAHDYLHAVLHCVFRHMFVHYSYINRDLWNLACDIAVEFCISELDIRATAIETQSRQQQVFDELKKCKQLTAERIYRYLLDAAPDQTKIRTWQSIFRADDHAIWYMNDDQKESAGFSSSERSDQDGKPNEKGDPNNNSDNDSGNDDGEQRSDSDTGRGDDMSQSESDSSSSVAEGSEEDWKNISERMQIEIESFAKQRGDRAGGLLQNLKEVNRERYDYSSFLRKFAVLGEVMKINDEEFDYVFYTYGLQLYKNMPLIEPLEYKEVKRIREFVIAIDTSGSVSGKTVQTFVQKTYNILKSTESFFSKINLHIIQCDAKIQEDVKITSQEDFDNYLKTMTIHGLGGTDFRPVFSYVDDLIRKHEFTNLKGLIYLTDGLGVFPSQKPPYSTAFVFLDNEYNNYDVPSWAIKLILQENEL